MKETILAKIDYVFLGSIPDVSYKHALAFSVGFDCEDGWHRSWGPIEFMSAAPIRHLLDIFEVEKPEELVGRHVYIERENNGSTDCNIIAFWPMATDVKEKRKKFVPKSEDWSDFHFEEKKK